MHRTHLGPTLRIISIWHSSFTAVANSLVLRIVILSFELIKIIFFTLNQLILASSVVIVDFTTLCCAMTGFYSETSGCNWPFSKLATKTNTFFIRKEPSYDSSSLFTPPYGPQRVNHVCVRLFLIRLVLGKRGLAQAREPLHSPTVLYLRSSTDTSPSST